MVAVRATEHNGAVVSLHSVTIDVMYSPLIYGKPSFFHIHDVHIEKSQ